MLAAEVLDLFTTDEYGARGQVSWLSPVARALMKAHQGDIVELRAPAGIEQIEVLAIRYGVTDRETD